MKRILVILIIFSQLGLMAQDNEEASEFKPTTRAEYDFVTVGYQIQLNTGLPMKAGYQLVSYEKCEFEHATVATKALFREGEDKPCAIMLVYSERFQKPRYFCVPTKEADEEIWKLYFASLEPQRLTNNSWLQYMTYCAGNTIMETHHKDYEKK